MEALPSDPVLKTSPTQHVFRIECTKRKYTLCAATKEAMVHWVKELKKVSKSALADAERLEKERQDSLEISGERDSVSRRGSNTRRKKKVTQVGNISEQTKAVESAKSQSINNYWTGNMPPTCLSLFSEVTLARTSLYESLKSHCTGDVTPYVDRIMSKSCFKFFTEGDVINLPPAGYDETLSTLHEVGFIYLLTEGEVIRVKEINGYPNPLGTIKQGGWFGSDVLVACHYWISEYRCRSKVNVLCIPADVFEELLDDPVFTTLREDVKMQIRTTVGRVLKALPLFHDIPPDGIEALAGQFEVRHYEPGEIIMKEGDESDSFVILLMGNGKISKVQANGDEVVLFTASPGDYFGEVGLLKHQPRAATITALGGAVCCTTTAEGFEEMMRIGGQDLRHRVKTQVDKQMHRFINRIDLFKGLDDYFDDIAKVMTFKQYRAKETLCRHGEPLDGFYNIVSGSAKKILEHVHTTEDLGGLASLATPASDGAGHNLPVKNRFDLPLEVGEFEESSTFGVYTAISRGSVAEYTVVTKVPCVILFIEKKNFQSLAQLAPSLQSRITGMLKKHIEASQNNDVSSSAFRNSLFLCCLLSHARTIATLI